MTNCDIYLIQPQCFAHLQPQYINFKPESHLFHALSFRCVFLLTFGLIYPVLILDYYKRSLSFNDI